MSILVVAQHMRGSLSEVTRELVTAAAELGGPVAVAAIAADPASLDLEQLPVDEVVHVPVAAAEFDSDVVRAALAELIRERRPQAVLLGFTVDSMSVAPAVAAELELGFASDVFGVAVDGAGIVATRAFYGGKVHGEVEFPGKECVVLLLRPGAWASAPGFGSPSLSESRPAPVTSRSRHRAFVDVARGDVDISEAEFLLSIGRGIGDQEAVERFESLAERFGAMLSVSRPLVDAGWAQGARQVGQSGKTVKPRVYLAFGISGAVQHVAGMKQSGTIIAVNTDPEAAIFGVAQYGAVADMFEVAAELEALV